MRNGMVWLLGFGLLGLAQSSRGNPDQDRAAGIWRVAQGVFFYPAEELKAGISGGAILRVVVSSGGELESAELIGATHPAFGEAALEGAKRIWFQRRTATRGAEPSCIIVIPVLFRDVAEQVSPAMQRLLDATPETQPPLDSILPFVQEVLRSRVEIDRARQHDRPPKLIERVQPIDPRGIGERKASVSVEVRFVVDTDGKVIDIVMADSVAPEFADRCRVALSKWRFEPGFQRGRNMKARATQIFEFPPAE